MQTLAKTAFNAVYAGIADARSKVRIGGQRGRVIDKAVCPNIRRESDAGEMGMINNIDGQVRYLQSDEGKAVAIGDLIEVQLYETETWTRARASSRHETGGVVNLGLQAVAE